MIQTVVLYSSQVGLCLMFLACLTLLCFAMLSPVALCCLVNTWY